MELSEKYFYDEAEFTDYIGEGGAYVNRCLC